MALRVPLKWLNDHVQHGMDPHELAERLTVAGMEVETVETVGAEWGADTVKVGEVVKVAPHPDADRLCLVTVAHGAAEPITVVTGAPNLLGYRDAPLPANPIKVPLALVGAELIDGHAEDGRKLKLKAGKIRGIRSEGMVCSEKELGLSDAHEGIMILPDNAPTGAPLRDYLGESTLEFDIKGGFAHLMCIYGIARETAALSRNPLNRAAMDGNMPDPALVTGQPDFIRLEIENPETCPRYTALLIEGIQMGPSPFEVQQRLMHAGMRPINAVVDATNYVMLELGQPIHAFDYDTLRGEGGDKTPIIRVRMAKPGEKMKTLDDVERVFDKDMQLITDGRGPVAIAGVMGGLETEISEGTTNVMLEAANFEFLNTRRTSQVLKLRTEAADRYGKRLDPELCMPASLRCAQLITQWCGGTLRPQYGDLYPARRTRPTIPLSPEFLSRLLGIDIPEEEVLRILTDLEFTVHGANPWEVTPPSHRLDIAIPADLVEEVGRVYGYDRMPHTLIADDLPPQRRNHMLDGTERIRDILTACGLDEIITYSMISLEDERRLHPTPEQAPVDAADYLAMVNPLSAEKAHLRRRLLAEGLNTLRANQRFGKRHAVFETGAVFHPAAGEVLPNEPRRLSALLTGPRHPHAWQDGPEGNGQGSFDFFDIKGVAEALLRGLEVGDLTWSRGEDPAYHPGRCAQVRSGERVLGTLGELHPRVASHFGLPATPPVCAMEFDVDALLEQWREDRQMDALSNHPPVYEDLAFIVADQVPAADVASLIAQTGSPLVRDVRLFDLYRGGQVGAGKKSLAYAITYQADDRTLTDDEVSKTRGKIVKRLERELEATLRG